MNYFTASSSVCDYLGFGFVNLGIAFGIHPSNQDGASQVFYYVLSSNILYYTRRSQWTHVFKFKSFKN